MLGELHGLDRRHSEALGAGLEEGDGVEADGFVDDDALLGEAADDGAASVPRRLDGALDLLQVALAVDLVAVGPSDGHRPVLRGKGNGGAVKDRTAGRSFGQSVGQSVGRSVGGSIGPWVGRFLAC